jgi:plasmid stabilization system protein ParE
MPVILAPEALADLAAIRAFIGADNPFAASRVAVQIVAACDRLALMPERGRVGLTPGTRELASAWPYLIVYRITPEGVTVLRIWHGSQDR